MYFTPDSTLPLVCARYGRHSRGVKPQYSLTKLQRQRTRIWIGQCFSLADQTFDLVDALVQIFVRHRLAREYRKSVDAFRDAVFATKGLKGPEYESAYNTSEKLRIAAEQARIALERHRFEHKC